MEERLWHTCVCIISWDREQRYTPSCLSDQDSFLWMTVYYEIAVYFNTSPMYAQSGDRCLRYCVILSLHTMLKQAIMLWSISQLYNRKSINMVNYLVENTQSMFMAISTNSQAPPMIRHFVHLIIKYARFHKMTREHSWLAEEYLLNFAQKRSWRISTRFSKETESATCNFEKCKKLKKRRCTENRRTETWYIQTASSSERGQP